MNYLLNFCDRKTNLAVFFCWLCHEVYKKAPFISRHRNFKTFFKYIPQDDSSKNVKDFL